MQTGRQLRHLFAMILLTCQPLMPEVLWNTHKLALCEDLLHYAQKHSPDQTVALNCAIENEALTQIEYYLHANDTSLENFPHMPIPSAQNTSYSYFANNDLDRLIVEDRSYNTLQ